MPGRMADHWHGDNETQAPGHEAEHHEADDDQRPDDGCRHIDEQRHATDNHRGDGVAVAVEHHRNRNPADRENDTGKDETDAGIDQ